MALCLLSRTNCKIPQLGSCTQLFYHSFGDLPARQLNHRYFVDTAAIAPRLHTHHQDINTGQTLSQMHQTKWHWKLLSITNTALCLCFTPVLHKPHPESYHKPYTEQQRSSMYHIWKCKSGVPFLNINKTSNQLLFTQLLFSSRAGCARAVMQSAANPHAH